MPTYSSPGVYTIEKDLSEYAPTINSSVVGIVGFASKGPTNVATLITSPQAGVNIFGQASEDIPGQGLEGMIEVLEATNQVYFVRADTGTSTDASATVSLGGCPAVMVSAGSYGVDNDLYLKVQVTNNLGTSAYSDFKSFAIPAGTSTSSQGNALKSVLGGSLDADKQGVFFDAESDASGWLVGRYAGSGASIHVKAYSDSAYSTPVSVLYEVDKAGATGSTAYSSIQVWGSQLDSDDVAYIAQSIYPGAGYNLGTKTDGSTSGNSVEIDNNGNHTSILTLNEDGSTRETFNHSLVENKNFITDVLQTGETNLKSEVIKGNFYFSAAIASDVTKLTDFTDTLTTLGLAATVGGSTKTVNTGATDSGATGFNPRFVKFVEGTYGLTGGSNGLGTASENRAAIIGDSTATPKTGIYALDDDLLNISLAMIPGRTSDEEQNALITLAEQTQNFVAVVAPPYGIGSVQNAIDWTNGQSDTRTAAINSSYAAVFWPWVQVFSQADNKDIWYDPSIYAARQLCFTDSVADPWFAGAGFIRGRLTKPTDTEVKLNQGDRDSLYSGGNIVNPIVAFPQRGITIWGNRTAQRAPSALDRVNVRRLMISLRKLILASTQRFVFEPNDEFTWQQVINTLNPALDDIKRRRGIVEFKVVCDETTNTPVRVDRNELWCKVLLKPTKTAEILVFELNVLAQGATLS
jgi:phage tail sheath protein FI